MKMREMKDAREGKEVRGETAVQEQMVSGEARKHGSENLDLRTKNQSQRKRKRKNEEKENLLRRLVN